MDGCQLFDANKMASDCDRMHGPYVKMGENHGVGKTNPVGSLKPSDRKPDVMSSRIKTS